MVESRRHHRFRHVCTSLTITSRGLHTAATQAVDLERHKFDLDAPRRTVFARKLAYLGLQRYFSNKSSP